MPNIAPASSLIIFNFFFSLCSAFQKKIDQDMERPNIATTFYSIAQKKINQGKYEKAPQAFKDVLGKDES